ncbi:SigE family RNA polymerase sigma factor [Virgisporangium aurantiacum]|uniref:RNA polymerase sigma24 factor n=1 Tax=Virgisporangium aurantiacum TaxID=175570 RepID=A0A8J4E193_9ACTN|nr:SigE family RNA polymerase sigma factor [Virgisporangium aurantiacum]GIJ57523.1 RNA polymerase sigma24 factor [Virgisporangium aurantiacum]
MADAIDEEFGQFVRSRLPGLRRAAHLLCGDWTRGDDVVQRTLTDVYVKWKRIRQVDNLDAYVRAVLVHRVIDEQRRGWARVRLVDRVPDVGGDDVRLDNVPAEVDVRAALAELSPRQRAVLVLRFFYDMSVEQTADALRCSPGTVKSQTSVALAAMRRRLTPSLTELGRN